MQQNDPSKSATHATAHFEFAVEGSRPLEHAKRIQESLRNFNGVSQVEIHSDEQRVTISFDPSATNPPAIHDYLLSHGYKPSARVAD